MDSYLFAHLHANPNTRSDRSWDKDDKHIVGRMLLRMGRYTIKLQGGVECLENAHVDKVVADAILYFAFFLT